MTYGFLSVSFSNKGEFAREIVLLKEMLAGRGITLKVFVDDYTFDPATQEHEMMMQAFADIEGAKFLLAEVSHKAIGVGVEVGYARGMGVPVVYLRRADAEHSTTISGSAQYAVVYSTIEDLKGQMRVVLDQLID